MSENVYDSALLHCSSVGCISGAREEAATESFEEEFNYSLSLDIYKDPMSLSCGHTFCKECIQEVINTNQQKPWDTYSHSIRQVNLLPFPKLQKNFQLCRIAEKFLAPPSKEDCWPELKPAAPRQEEGIPCDFCLGQPQRAVRNCLNCEASFCQDHLRKQHQDCPVKPCPVEPHDLSYLL
ncbi:unnamed protein product [Caretta caretta]